MLFLPLVNIKSDDSRIPQLSCAISHVKVAPETRLDWIGLLWLASRSDLLLKWDAKVHSTRVLTVVTSLKFLFGWNWSIHKELEKENMKQPIIGSI